MLLLFLVGIETSIMTFLGGCFALHFKDRMHLILGFSAGAVIGVVFFDLLPETFLLGQSYNWELPTVATIIALGFVSYMMLDRYSVLSCGSREDEHDEHCEHGGHIGAGSLVAHSYIDGLVVGLSFQTSQALGVIVAIAVLVHDFSDGINTVNMSLVGNGKTTTAKRWLLAGALAPLFGIGTTLLFTISEKYLVVVLAIFCGFFMYIGASELIPESHHRHPRFWTSLMTILGMAIIYAAVNIAGF
jgi:ZIP family zinc transporter